MLNFREAPSFKSFFAADGVYRILKPMTVNGVPLDRGDMLPQDSTLRQKPYRLQQLCEQNRMVPVTAPVPMGPRPQPTQPSEAQAPKTSVAPEPQPAAAKAPRVPADILSLSLRELQHELKVRGVDHVGNKGQLRKRLTAALAG